MSDWTERVLADPRVCHGKPCIKGTRVMVSVVLDSLAEGSTRDEILADYPSLGPEDIDATLGYAAALAREEELLPMRRVGSRRLGDRTTGGAVPCDPRSGLL
ncbi:MAG: antitoxin [Armatimonadetes bacterium CG_4_10_14_3_um_filter_66_18]|nr:DUF433 domain-containing protein [Armatimonadota bacterium]OIP10481.1 MAG: hypothetical protein AUJ96_03820 [Armatimonadetes bacterium CG2_30_66_41]PIU94895.1 MAG: antitoxin [Armatimonadetes bacterium CG06_land_8_20_14_3_00_66_21]PIX46225.1 MAG: antitoxin [Armatimonadetes bacterium CG_4_8_14_3_um_filter_66_20]PIY42170.1 MAG: antitoxin [Armatimonadetes bacterium CG_4_10_14_3_um_filter_66_18]PIZ50881.1 MAG: antitoxin [Armatimonadetes bacterium CG_4_10_14_0_8_um_filter_66_14]